MKHFKISHISVFILVLITGYTFTLAAEDTKRDRQRLSMDFGWKFTLGHLWYMERDFSYGGGNPVSNSKAGDAVGAVKPDFDDNSWENLDLPHDWAVGLQFIRNEQWPGFNRYIKKIGRKHPENSIGWYRRRFNIEKSDLGRRLAVEFDGVFSQCQVWLNGYFLGIHQSGYSSFTFDITDYANYGGENVLVVRVDASQYELWSYEGAGIYRHVWLVKTQPLHVARWGTYVTTELEQNSDKSLAKLTIETTVENEQDENAKFELVSIIIDPDDREVAIAKSEESISAWESKEITQKVKVSDARLWSLDSPELYTISTTVKQASMVVDTYETTFGIRTIKFNPNKGFFLNGKHLKLKGVCCHQDYGGVGVAVPDRIQYYRIEKLKEIGVNAYRCAHNWVAPELLKACDELGMLVMNETRMSGSTDELLNQLESMVRRDRNHPSVILWCLGNEEHKLQGNDRGARVIRSMKRLLRRLDLTRPMTLAMNGSWGSVVTEEVDVQGCNYLACGDIEKLHRDFPDKPIILSEAASALSTRGIYSNSEQRGYYSAYDENHAPWGKTAEEMWNYCLQRDWLAGTFVWTGFDYCGEPHPRSWPCVHSNYGFMDRCGFAKDNYYYYKAWWSDEIVLHVLPHWNWSGKEGQPIAIWSHSNCDEVELIVNGKSLGKKTMPRHSHLEWMAEYQPGYIEVKGYNGGKMVTTKKVETTGEPEAIRLRPNRTKIKADNQDISLVTVEVVDDKGRVVPTADNEITLDITHNGKIIGVCNGDPSCQVPENQTTYTVFNGLMMVFVQSGWKAGLITLKAKGLGLKGADVIIEAETCNPEPFVPSIVKKSS